VRPTKNPGISTGVQVPLSFGEGDLGGEAA